MLSKQCEQRLPGTPYCDHMLILPHHDMLHWCFLTQRTFQPHPITAELFNILQSTILTFFFRVLAIISPSAASISHFPPSFSPLFSL